MHVTRNLPFGLALICLGFQSAHAAELGTAFTYQGRLVKAGTPVNATCTFAFGLWDAATMGNQKGTSPQGPSNIAVTDGIFVTSLNFGASAINGQARWLEITVQCPGDGSATTLTPRQELKPTPHALALPGLYTLQDAFSPSLIGGNAQNNVMAGVQGATIAGGGANAPDNNKVTDTFGAVGGGCSNRAGNNNGLTFDSQFATVAGGFANIASGQYAAIGGGGGNNSTGNHTTIGGGETNTASIQHSTVAGGLSNQATASFAAVGGGEQNVASGQGAAIAGGDTNMATGARGSIGGGWTNTAAGDYSTVAGGDHNSASQLRSNVGGGINNHANGSVSTIGGGGENTTTGFECVIAGGSFNTANGDNSAIGGGQGNTANGDFATVPGGALNDAGGDYSFAAGHRAKVRDAAGSGDANGDEGTFVWADDNLNNFISDGPNRFLVRASGGTKIYSNNTATVGVQLAAGGNSWSMLSDRNAKENFTTIDPREVLQRLADIPITIWNLKSQSHDIHHIGPMAQDFHAAFNLGESETHITSTDADGVALAAIQGLNQLLNEKDCEITALQEEVTRLKATQGEIAELKALVTALINKSEGAK